MSTVHVEAPSAWTKKDRDSSKCEEPSVCKKATKLQTWPFLMEKKE